MQTFAPMTKDFATFDFDAHITEPAAIWERAEEHLIRDELEIQRAAMGTPGVYGGRQSGIFGMHTQ